MSKKRNWEAGENLESEGTPEIPETPETLTPPPQAEAPAQPIAKIEPVQVAVDPSALMALRVFATLAGPKWDQMAGFVAWAQAKKLQPMTMEQWRVEFQSFKDRPVG